MSNILISTPPTSLATGLLQLDGGVAISSTPVYVADQNNTDSVLSLSTGNVGINTTSTFARLTIANTNTLNTQYLISASTSTANFYVRNDGYLYNAEQGRISNVLIANISSNSLSSTSSSASGGALYLTGTGTGIGGTTSFTPSAMAHIKGSTSSGAIASLLVQNSGGTQLFRVDNDGLTYGIAGNFSSSINVGSASGSARLSVKGSGSTSATTTALFQNSSSTTSLLIRDDGNVGIGDSSPYKTLSVKTTISTEGIQVRGADSSAPTPYTGIRFSVADQSVVTDTYNKGAIYYINNTLSNAIGSFVFALNNAGSGANVSLTDEKMRLLNNGNLLIGTTTDAGFKLQVNGDGYLSQVRVGTGGGSISSNTIVGYQALNTNSSGGFNTGMGFQSLQGITTSSYNASFGYRSLYISSTGSNNTSIGALNSALNSTGSNNTSVGYGAHYSNSTGSNNTLVGYNCQATNFDSCVVLGRDASATASNQFVVGSASYNAGTVVVGANASTQYWNVKINGVDYKILLA